MIVINNRDYNIDQNNCDYDFGHNRAALVEGAAAVLREKQSLGKKKKRARQIYL